MSDIRNKRFGVPKGYRILKDGELIKNSDFWFDLLKKEVSTDTVERTWFQDEILYKSQEYYYLFFKLYFLVKSDNYLIIRKNI